MRDAIEEFRNFESNEDGQTGLIDQVFGIENRLTANDFLKRISSKEL